MSQFSFDREREAVFPAIPAEQNANLRESMVPEMTVSQQVLKVLRAHAESSLDAECCGALFGTESHVECAFPLKNASPTPRHAFEVSASSYLSAEREASRLGLRVQGFYHSHVEAGAQPSLADVRAAEHFHFCIILSLRGGVAEAPRCFVNTRGGVVECRMVVVK
jgi:desampylase